MVFQVLVVTSCAQVASVLFDVPEPSPRDANSAPAAPTTSTAVQDTSRPEMEIERLHDPDTVLARLPQHTDGEVDWVRAVAEGIIAPRESAPGSNVDGYVDGFGYDFVIRGSNEMFDSQFPHSAHAEWLTCQSCHPALYPYRDLKTSMKEINEGESCGACHGPVAFPASACSRCHTGMPTPELEAKLEDDIVFERADSLVGGGFAPARFAHWSHRIRYRCSACHDTLFEMERGGSDLSMSTMQAGGSCGTCHNGEAAFSISDCQSCHPTNEP